MRSVPTQLYRHYDNDGVLLYIGISLSHLNRLSQHKSNSSWFTRIVSVDIEHYPTRELALIAEKDAIIRECPVYNRDHNTSSVKVRVPKDYDDYCSLSLSDFMFGNDRRKKLWGSQKFEDNSWVCIFQFWSGGYIIEGIDINDLKEDGEFDVHPYDYWQGLLNDDCFNKGDKLIYAFKAEVGYDEPVDWVMDQINKYYSGKKNNHGLLMLSGYDLEEIYNVLCSCCTENVWDINMKGVLNGI